LYQKLKSDEFDKKSPRWIHRSSHFCINSPLPIHLSPSSSFPPPIAPISLFFPLFSYFPHLGSVFVFVFLFGRKEGPRASLPLFCSPATQPFLSLFLLSLPHLHTLLFTGNWKSEMFQIKNTSNSNFFFIQNVEISLWPNFATKWYHWSNVLHEVTKAAMITSVYLLVVSLQVYHRCVQSPSQRARYCSKLPNPKSSCISSSCAKCPWSIQSEKPWLQFCRLGKFEINMGLFIPFEHAAECRMSPPDGKSKGAHPLMGTQDRHRLRLMLFILLMMLMMLLLLLLALLQL